MSVPDTKALEQWTGLLPKLGKIELSGDLKRESKEHFEIPSLKGKIGGSEIDASVSLDLAGSLPAITGRIGLTELDVRIFDKDDGETPEEVARRESAEEIFSEDGNQLTDLSSRCLRELGDEFQNLVVVVGPDCRIDPPRLQF